MAKTTRKTEPATADTKPAVRRKKAADQPAAAVKGTTRRRTKAAAAELPVETTPVPEPTHDEIALRAWSIYQRRGGSHGQAMNDWLEAKTQLFLERGLKP
jgi:hypothetical protein